MKFLPYTLRSREISFGRFNCRIRYAVEATGTWSFPPGRIARLVAIALRERRCVLEFFTKSVCVLDLIYNVCVKIGLRRVRGFCRWLIDHHLFGEMYDLGLIANQTQSV